MLDGIRYAAAPVAYSCHSITVGELALVIKFTYPFLPWLRLCLALSALKSAHGLLGCLDHKFLAPLRPVYVNTFLAKLMGSPSNLNIPQGA